MMNNFKQVTKAVFKSINHLNTRKSLSISIFPMLWINIAQNSKFKKYVYITPMVIISIILIIAIGIKKNYYLEEELNRNGINITGKVIGFETEHHRRSTTDYARFNYEFENKEYIQRIENYDQEYKLSQNLNLKNI